MLVLNRFDEIPDFVRQVGVLADCTLTSRGPRRRVMADALVAQLAHSENLSGLALPETEDPTQQVTLPADRPLIVLRDGVVSYNDRPILNHLDWQVNPGEHWQIVGPNGAGKSTLLSLITGDHPQGYSNDPTLSAAAVAAGKPSGRSSAISATSAAACIWTIASTPACAMWCCRGSSTRSAFIRRSQIVSGS